MKKMWKRFVSLLLACTLLAGMLPLSASAAVSAPGEGSEQYKYAESILNKLNESITNEQEKYGLYGPALLADSELYTYSLQRSIYDKDSGKWTTDTQYILVPGVDAQNTTTPNYNGLNSGQPWAESNPSAIYIAEGVTGIGNYAFASQPSLNSVVFQDASDLTYIGQRAFYEDDNAVFTDEGNGDGTTLDLSGVTTMGEYAFYNCDKLTGVELGGNITAVETVEGKVKETEHKIPNNAFNNSGLQTVTIPDGIQHIGDGAFGHTSLSKVEDLVLPDGLKTIGDNAFVVTMGSGETGIGITSLTIPSSVNSIGANAFSGRRNLAEVTVEDDNVSNTQLTLGNAAFGFNESSAFSEWGSITDDRTGQKYEGTMGTKFYLPADLTEKFINGTNCYTGDIEPMKWVKTQQPTCDTDGYHLYETTKKGAYDDEGKPLVLQYKYTIPMLGHDYQLKKSFSATCETNSYELWVCTRDETHTENRKIGEVSKPKGHNYQLTQVDDTEMGGGNDTTFTWVCQTKEHDDTRDSLDKTLEITIEPATIQANTSMTVGDLADMMPQVDGGKLSLAEDEKLDAALTTDTKPVRVVFTPDEVKYADYTNVGAVSEFNNADLTLEVNVSKAKLDFSSVRFGNCLVGINPGEEVNVPITIERGNLPEDVKAGAPVYTEHGNKEGSTTPPSIGKSWTGTVSVTFNYDPNKYEEETNNLPEEYKYSRDPNAGTVTITHSYVVTKLEMTNVSATAIPDLAYTGSSMNTVHVYGIPANSTVFWKWVSTTDGSVTGTGSAKNENSPNLQIAEITNAGTYKVTITIQNASYEDYTLPKPVTVNIQKAKVETPEPKEDLVYTSYELTGLVSPDENAEYAYKEGSKLAATDAGTYTATAVLTDTANYEWTGSDNDGDGAVTISWNIAKRPVIETSITEAFKNVRYDGTVKRAVSEPTNATNFFTVSYVNGTLIGKVTSNQDKEAFTIMHAEETNAGTYDVTATITDFENFCWQKHSEVESYSLGTWTINPLQINAPTITAPDAAYDGVPYDGEVTLKHSEASDSRGSSRDIIDLENTQISYYTTQNGGEPLQSAPINVRDYYAGVQNWAFVEGKVSTNYQILGGSRAPFSISKAIATMEFSQKEVSAPYTAEGTPLQQVKVTNLVTVDVDKPASDVYTVTYTYKYRENDSTDWNDVEEERTIKEPSNFKFTNVGEYQITATFRSNNYTAADATYTLTITQADDQKITLTSAETNAGEWDEENNSYTTTYGSENTFTVTGQAALDDAEISYAVKDDSEKGHDGKTADVVSVDSTGEVTIKQAGEATITVTAADTDNVKGTSVEYTVTVNQAKPTVSLTDNKLEVPYTGKPITGYDIAEPTANVVEEAAPPTGAITYTFYRNEGCTEKFDDGAGGTVPIAVGTYYMKASYPGDKNYLPAVSEVVTVTVTEAQLTVDAKGYTGTYNGKPHDPASITVTGVNGVISSGYTISYAKKTDGQTDAPEATSDAWKTDTQVKDVADSGDYWIKVVINGDDSSYDPYVGKEPITVTINPKPLQIKKEVTARKPYDGTKKATVEFKTINTGVDGEEINVTNIRAEYDSAEVNASSIIITYTLTEENDNTNLDNYIVSAGGEPIVGGSAEETVTQVGGTKVGIYPASITVAISNQSSVYDGSAPTVSNVKDTDWKVTDGEIYQLVPDTDDDLGITLSIDSGSKDAGAYAITGNWTNSNYTVTFTGNWTDGTAGTYTIDHRPIDVKIGDADGFYGDVPVLDNVALDDVTGDGVSDAGLVDGEVLKNVLTGLKLATTANAQSDISNEDTPYPIYAKKGEAPIQAPTQLGNYNVTFTNEGTYTVKQRPITITIADHSSVYGAEIDGGIAHPVSDKDYKVDLTKPDYTGSGGSAIVNEDVLTVTLETTASATAAAGTYDITGSAEGNKVNNYAITWAGNGGNRDDEQGQNGRYTIEEAELAISFEKGNQVVNGVSINITDNYNDNPLVLENASTSVAVSEADKATLDITYSIGAAGGGAGGVSQIAEIDKKTGEVTIHSTGTVRVTATVTAKGDSNCNYTGAQTTWYELNIISGGQMALKVTPKTNLAYTGDPQALLESASCSLEGATIKYSLDNQDWQNTIPKGTNAGTYTVYVKATDPNSQYSDVTEHVTVTIDKADLEGTFKHGEKYTHVLVDGNSYDSATANELTISSAGYDAKPAKYTYRSADTTVAMAENGGSTIRIMGSAGQETTITVTVPGDNNYNEGTFTYTLEISDNLSKIVYSVENKEVTYNGQPQTIEVKVTQPASGATVMYWNEKTSAYDLSEPPAYTDVQDDGYTIKFQITAPGYKTVTDEATLKIEPKKITETIIAGIAESYTYTGKGITFDDAISVHDEGVLLEKDKDYTITYGDNKEVGQGTVTITGMGNYKESVTKNFTISPVDASDLTASLDRTFGYYGDSNTNNATVTVTHGSHTVDSSEITLTVTRQDSTIESGDVVQEGLKLTFNKAGIYTIHVVVSGTHKGAFDLTYTLLPQDVASDDFQVTTNPVDRVWTYDGGNHAFGVTVTSGGTPLQKDVDFTLRYTYLPYVGSQEEREYDPESTEFTEAGIYTVIVEGTGNYTGHAELVALIQPRDLSDADIAAVFAQTGLVYNGEAQEPEVALTYNGTAINQLKNTEYYGNTNAGEAQALSAASAGCNNFTGARVDAFTIEKKSLNDSTITAKADPEEYYYTGHPVTPAVTVTDSGRNADLSIGADYTVTSDAVGPGKVTATVTGTGNYKDTVKVEFTILPTGAEPVETLDLTVTPSEWTWDNGKTKAAISVTFNGKELNDTDYQLTVSKDGETPRTVTKEQAVELLSAPGKYTITATGVGAYNGSTDTETVTIQKIQPKVTVTATPNSLSGGGKVTLTLKGEKLPNGTDLKTLLSVTAKNDNDVTLEDLHIQWPEDGSLTAELTLPNTNETYTFTLSFAGNDYYESASSNAMVVVGQQTSGGGGGGPVEDQPADPDDTGVSDWLNTKDHLAYLAGYPGGTFGPDQNMTRAEAAQMFYNLLLEKDVEITVEFEDVPADAWYAKPVNTLASLGILSGVGNGRFDPERSITRAEFTVIAMKFANTSGGGVNIFSDVNEDDWFYSAVVDSTQYGWINGYPDGTFRPEATISRAEVTVIVNHMLGRAADRPYVIAHEKELNTFGDVNRGHWGYFHIAEATNAHEYHTEDGTESWTGLS